MENQIPKKLHFCWFGGKPYDETMQRCMKSWKKFAPDFEVYEWNEKTYNLDSAPAYVKKAFAAKKWAFVSDFVRLEALSKFGGVYVDTDMELVKNIASLLNHSAFLGFEDKTYVNNAIMGAIPHHPFIERAIKWYLEDHPRTPTPIIMTSLLKENHPKLSEKEQEVDGVYLYPSIAFYPYSKETIKNFSYKDLSDKTYSVHFWNYSWGHPMNKFFKRIGIYKFGKKSIEKFGIKKIIKKILGFE